MASLTLPTRTVKLHAFGFDVDGVLRDTGYQAFENCQRAIAQLGGIPPAFEDFVHDWSGLLIEYYRTCGVTASDEEIRRVNEIYVAGHDEVAPFHDVLEILAYFESLKLPTFALSSHAEDKLQKWFVKHELHTKFVHIQGDGRQKVDQLRALCNRLGVEPAHAGYIGDWAQDMRAAKEAGLIPIGITRFHASREVLLRNGAEAVVDELVEIKTLLA
jgi:phosphoglycolate phosphatase